MKHLVPSPCQRYAFLRFTVSSIPRFINRILRTIERGRSCGWQSQSQDRPFKSLFLKMAGSKRPFPVTPWPETGRFPFRQSAALFCPPGDGKRPCVQSKLLPRTGQRSVWCGGDLQQLSFFKKPQQASSLPYGLFAVRDEFVACRVDRLPQFVLGRRLL